VECLTKDLNNRYVGGVLKSSYTQMLRHTENYIPIENYIIFLSRVPRCLWSEKPILYQKENSWDALGLLGEKMHRSLLRTKFIQLCFKRLGINITDILDNEHELFYKYTNNKERFLAALHYAENNLNDLELTGIYAESKKLCDNGALYN
jgi:hypothetical protein